jgi:hypothetical protein
MEVYWGSEGIAPRILDLGTSIEVSGQLHDPARFIPRERVRGAYWIRGWVGPRAGLDTVAKRKIIPSLPLPRIEPRSSSP